MNSFNRSIAHIKTTTSSRVVVVVVNKNTFEMNTSKPELQLSKLEYEKVSVEIS